MAAQQANNEIDSHTATQTIFGIKHYYAKAILPLLRREDVKIAYAQYIVFTLPKKERSTAELKQARIDAFSDQSGLYAVLDKYISSNNLDVALTLDLFNKNSIPGGEDLAYFYPRSTQKPGHQLRTNLDTKSNTFFSGSIPARRLRFATFLYYCGNISYASLIESLAWQKNQRPLLGQIAMQIGLMTPCNFARTLMSTRNGTPFGAAARKLDLLNEKSISSIVHSQKKYNCQIGRFFIERKLLSESQVQSAHTQFVRHNCRFAV
jgi:hypothetical protein